MRNFITRRNRSNSSKNFYSPDQVAQVAGCSEARLVGRVGCIWEAGPLVSAGVRARTVAPGSRIGVRRVVEPVGTWVVSRLIVPEVAAVVGNPEGCTGAAVRTQAEVALVVAEKECGLRLPGNKVIFCW